MTRIERMTDAHLEAVVALERACFLVPWTRTQVAQSHLMAGAIALVLMQSEELIGYALVQMSADEAELLRIAVAPMNSRKGYGSQLLRECIARARSSGCNVLFLEVRAGDMGAQAFYATAGFRRVSLRKRYFSNPVDDAHILMLPLT